MLKLDFYGEFELKNKCLSKDTRYTLSFFAFTYKAKTSAVAEKCVYFTSRKFDFPNTE